MSTRHIAEIACERCGQTGELVKMPSVAGQRGGGRWAKPTHWGRIVLSEKPEVGLKVKVIGSMDLCPACLREAVEFTGVTPEDSP